MRLVIFHIALFDLRTAACKLPTDVGGPTYFLISFTSSRVCGEGGTANEEISPLLLFYQQALHRYSLAGSPAGSARTINKRARRSSRIAYRCTRWRSDRRPLFSSREHTRAPTRQFRVSVCTRLSGTSAKILGATHVIKSRDYYTLGISDANRLGHKRRISKPC